MDISFSFCSYSEEEEENRERASSDMSLTESESGEEIQTCDVDCEYCIENAAAILLYDISTQENMVGVSIYRSEITPILIEEMRKISNFIRKTVNSNERETKEN